MERLRGKWQYDDSDHDDGEGNGDDVVGDSYNHDDDEGNGNGDVVTVIIIQVLYEVTASGVYTSCTVTLILLILGWGCC